VDSCTKEYNCSRSVTSNTCGNGYTRDASKDEKNTNTYSKPVSGLNKGSCDGSFDSYIYEISSIDANVKDLKVESITQLYPNGSFGNISADCGRNATGSVTATVVNNKYYKYSATATNCQIELVSRTSSIGNTPVTGQQSASATQTVTINPENYTFAPTDDGHFTVTVLCNNVIVSGASMVDGSKVIRYKHPDLIADNVKNVRIVDFAYSDSNKPRKYGNIVFGKDNNGTLENKNYQDFEHLKYWFTSGCHNHLYRIDNVPGDYFIQLMDYNGNSPSVKWFFPASGGVYGAYTETYSFSGLNRVFFPWGEQEVYQSNGARVDLVSSDENEKMVFMFGGFTVPINNVLMLNGYQTGAGAGEIAPPQTDGNTPDAAVARVTADACAKLIEAAGSNTKVYVVKYGSNAPTTLNSCGPREKIIVYSADSESALDEKLREIAADIKSFALYENARVEEE
jgi:hypothetical protein